MADACIPIRYELYSRHGRLLDCTDSETRAKELFGEWPSAKFLVGVADNGDRIVIAERKEIRSGN